jgi:hypothetical protein
VVVQPAVILGPFVAKTMGMGGVVMLGRHAAVKTIAVKVDTSVVQTIKDVVRPLKRAVPTVVSFSLLDAYFAKEN